MTKDEEIKTVVTELDALLSQLQDNVDALTAILVPPASAAEGVTAL